MNVIDQYFEIIQKPENGLIIIENAGRTCYKSEDKISEGSALKFAKMLLNQNHESVLEHVSVSVRFITNRGVSHEMVRHRLCAFSQESTRYVNYKNKPMEFIRPVWWNKWSEEQQNIWTKSIAESEASYLDLLKSRATPELAREVLPNSLKTEIVVTTNIREWRHIFKLRCSPQAHPQMRELMRACCSEFKSIFPELFDDIVY